jgi:hypothetical protein
LAETFPVAFGVIDLKPAGSISFAEEESGLLIVGRKPNRPWKGRFTTGRLDQAEHADLFGLLLKAEERNLRFDFVHPRFRLPRSYNAGSWPMVGDAELEAVTDLYTLTCSGLSMGLLLKRGDRLTIMQDDLRCYCMLSADVTVASISAQALPVLPRLPIGVFAAGAAVRLEDPMVRLALVPGGYDMAEEVSPRPVSIDVIEALV